MAAFCCSTCNDLSDRSLSRSTASLPRARIRIDDSDGIDRCLPKYETDWTLQRLVLENADAILQTIDEDDPFWSDIKPLSPRGPLRLAEFGKTHKLSPLQVPPSPTEVQMLTPTSISTDVASDSLLVQLPWCCEEDEPPLMEDRWLPTFRTDKTLQKIVTENAESIFEALYDDDMFSLGTLTSTVPVIDCEDGSIEPVRLLTPQSMTTLVAPELCSLPSDVDATSFEVADEQWDVKALPRSQAIWSNPSVNVESGHFVHL